MSSFAFADRIILQTLKVSYPDRMMLSDPSEAAVLPIKCRCEAIHLHQSDRGFAEYLLSSEGSFPCRSPCPIAPQRRYDKHTGKRLSTQVHEISGQDFLNSVSNVSWRTFCTSHPQLLTPLFTIPTQWTARFSRVEGKSYLGETYE
jgi:hypothetical protein